MLGEMNFISNFVQADIEPFTIDSYLLFFFFVIVLPVALMNLLVSLEVRRRCIWKGIRVTMLFDLLTCIMQCCYIQCMIIQCLIFFLQFPFDFITFHFFFLQSCFHAFDICPSSMQDFHCGMRYAILRSTIIHTPSCHYSYFVMPSLLRLC